MANFYWWSIEWSGQNDTGHLDSILGFQWWSMSKLKQNNKSLLIFQQIYLHTFPQYQIQDTHNFKKNRKGTEFRYLVLIAIIVVKPRRL